MKTKRLTKRKSKKLSFTTIAIIGEGFCEYNYFQSMKEFEKKS